MKKISLLSYVFCLCMLIAIPAFSQLSIPDVEEVYGGRIIGMSAISVHQDTTRLYITTESANSAFYTDVYSNGSSIVFSDFQVMAGMDANAGLGDNLNIIAAHAPSKVLFYVKNGSLKRTHPDSTSSGTVFTVGVNALMIKDSTLLFIEDKYLHFAKLSDNSDDSTGLGSPLTIVDFVELPLLLVNPVNNILYIFEGGNFPKLYKFSDAYNSLSSGTTYSDISPTLDSSIAWMGAGIGPDGRIFFAGTNVTNKHIAYTDDESTWNTYSLTQFGMVGRSFAFSDTGGTEYQVYNSNMYNTNSGDSGYWNEFGSTGFETHPNDGDVLQDPNFMHVAYMTTDMGIGASENFGPNIFEINDGVEAVRVDDIDMTASKNLAWVASKSGIRDVTNYSVSPSWSNARYPNDDGSPYFSVAMDPSDSNSVYVGNIRVYKTIDAGGSWIQAFTPEVAPWNFPSFGMIGEATKAAAIEVCPYNTDVVMAGYTLGDTQKGGLFYSLDGGASWNQQLLHATVDGQDVDVTDVVFNLEGSDTVAYVSVEYDMSSPSGWSVYRLVKSGMGWTVNQDMDASGTSSGSSIVVTLTDLTFNAAGDTLYACGTDAGNTNPHVYYKDLVSTNKWHSLPTSGFVGAGNIASAVTYGVDTLYCAVENQIYIMPRGSSVWTLGYAYPAGTEINVLYYDELMVGTGTGLYTHVGVPVITGISPIPLEEGRIEVFPNPVTDRFTISLNDDREIDGISLWDIQGKMVLNIAKPNRSEYSIDRSELKSGIYFLSITRHGKHNVYKLILK